MINEKIDLKKAIIFDSSTLISFVMNGLLDEFKKLKEIFNGEFLIPHEVKYEVIDRPINIKRFELEALELKSLLDNKILKLPEDFGIKEELISRKTSEMLKKANSIFYGNGRYIHLIDSGETACLVLSKILSERKIKNVIAVDERTTRMLFEKPENLRKLLERKIHIKIIRKNKDLPLFKDFKFIRSSELIYIAYEKGLINLKGKKVLDSLLYAMKFKGCAISEDEIREAESINKKIY